MERAVRFMVIAVSSATAVSSLFITSSRTGSNRLCMSLFLIQSGSTESDREGRQRQSKKGQGGLCLYLCLFSGLCLCLFSGLCLFSPGVREDLFPTRPRGEAFVIGVHCRRQRIK